jgi:hypothetical protein
MRTRRSAGIVAAAVVVVLTACAPPPVQVVPTVPASTTLGPRLPFAQTDGDILDVTKVQGAARELIAFGGNFTAVATPDGVRHAATNFAVVDELTGALVYAGSASSYVRTITSRDGTVYVGGDFTSFGGLPRQHLAALSPDLTVTPWDPAPPFVVRAALAGPEGVYVGGDGTSLRLVDPLSGSTRWLQPVSGGAVRALVLSPDGSALYAGGLFETLGGATRHGLVKLDAATGVPDPTFDAKLRADSGSGAHPDSDGEEVIRLAFDAERGRVLAGIAGYGADEFGVLDPDTGARIWLKTLRGDCQAVAIVGSTYVVGYHRNIGNAGVPFPYFAAQLEAARGQLTDWDPGLTGNQGNEDGGNNGVQAAFADPAHRLLFVAGAFTTPVKSLAVFGWDPPPDASSAAPQP